MVSARVAGRSVGRGSDGYTAAMRPRWSGGPARLVLVRHGLSVGNEADDRAREAHAEALDLRQRDADVELAAQGREQADAVGHWLARQEAAERPELVVTSPFRRAAETAERALALLAEDERPPLAYDERLRERDLGLFDGLTGRGIRARHPEEAERRNRVGKFYYQPPCGESWCDVVLRARSFLGDLRVGFDDARIWVFTHQAVVMAFRYALEDLGEQRLLEIDKDQPIPNASMTSFRRKGGLFELERFADTAAVDQTEADLTREAPQSGRGSHEHS